MTKYIVTQGCYSITNENDKKYKSLMFERCIGIYNTFEEAVGKAWLYLQRVRNDELYIIDHKSEDEVGNVEGFYYIGEDADDEYGKMLTLRSTDAKGNECEDFVKIFFYDESEENR